MKKGKFLFCFLIFGIISFLSLASCQELSVEHHIIENKVLTKMNFYNIEEINFNIPSNSKITETSLNESEFLLNGKNNYNNVLVTLQKTKNFSFEYVSDYYLEKSGSKNFFQIKNDFEFQYNVSLFLSPGLVLENEGLLFPEPSKITSDGQRVILFWKNFNEDQIIVSYNDYSTNNYYWTWILAFFIFIGIVFYFKQKRKFIREMQRIQSKKKREKTKQKKDLTKNLLKEEKKIVEYLLNKKGKESWTKEIVKDLDIGKVRLSRKLRNLEEKDLIERIPYGNENKIKLKK